MTAQRTKSQASRLPASLRRLLAPALVPALGTLGLTALAVAGCNPGTFVDLGNQAPVVAFGRPSNFRRTGFGANVAAVEGRLRNGELATRLAVGGGPDTGTWLYDIWNSDAVGTFAISNTACETPADDCITGTGSALAGVAQYSGEGTCVAIGEAAADQVRVKCESAPSMTFTSSTGADSGREFGFAIAAVPEGSVVDTRGALLVGAPASDSDRGSFFRIPVGGGTPVEIGEVSVAPGVVGTGGRLGETIATASLPDSVTLGTSFPTVPAIATLTPYLAVLSAPGQDRVVIAAIGVDALDATDIDAQVLACLDGTPGFGQVLAAGDIDGDGMPEVYVGYGEASADHPNAVQVYDLADLNQLEMGCASAGADDDMAHTTIACPTIDGVDCTDGAFGSALALGDVDADGTLDLIVGAPRMTVENRVGAGGVFALSGSASGVDVSAVSFMHISEPGANDRLGASVAALRTHYGIPDVTPRHEVAAGAPGTNSAFIFLCSGLGDDSSSTGSRCLEQATE
jgi:hypothetical protein